MLFYKCQEIETAFKSLHLHILRDVIPQFLFLFIKLKMKKRNEIINCIYKLLLFYK